MKIEHTWGDVDLLSWVYDGFDSVLPSQWYDFYSARAVVTPTNTSADEINLAMLDRLPAAREKISRSFDTASAEVSLDDSYSPEFLHTLNSGGLPPHELRLRPGCLVILLRNYAPHKGMCNGTRMVVEKFYKHLLVVRIVTGPFRGCVEFLPRITCDSSGDSELPFALRRHQYPIKLAWAMTINKAQGQSIPARLGIFLPSPVFAHGQLYVAFSRGVSFANVRVLVHDNSDSKQRVLAQPDPQLARQYTVNIVDRALLRAASDRTSDSSKFAASVGISVSEQTSSPSSSMPSALPFSPSTVDDVADYIVSDPSTPSSPLTCLRRLSPEALQRCLNSTL